jgi:hypothetical protein
LEFKAKETQDELARTKQALDEFNRKEAMKGNEENVMDNGNGVAVVVKGTGSRFE